MQAKVTEAEFIKIWERLRSVTLVAKELGLNVRSVQTRRRTIEGRHGISLENRPVELHQAELRGLVLQLGIEDGTILIGSDAHIWPGELDTIKRGFLWACKALKPTHIIANGDWFDGASISRHPSIGWETKPSVVQELEAVKDFTHKVEKAAKGAKKYWTLGNHDMRLESRLAHQAPEFVTMHGTRLRDHFPGWEFCWRVDINESIVVRHREAGGEHADWNNTVKSGRTIVTGHDHRLGVVPFTDYNGTRYGVRCGYMCDTPLSGQFANYLEAKAPNWHPGFVVLTIKDGELLMPELVSRLSEDRIQFRGQVVTV